MLAARELKMPDLQCVSSDPAHFKLLRVQPQAAFFYSGKNGPYCRDLRLYNKCEAALELARREQADLVLFPEYCVPYPLLERLAGERELWPSYGRMWCLPCQGIPFESFALFLERVRALDGVVLLDQDLREPFLRKRSFVNALFYCFKAYQHEQEKLVLLPQLKLHPMRDDAYLCESEGMITGRMLYSFQGEQVCLLSLICADVYQANITWEVLRRETGKSHLLLLHPQLNGNPEEEAFCRMRRELMEGSAPGLYLSCNWAAGTSLTPEGGGTPEQVLALSRARIYRKYDSSADVDRMGGSGEMTEENRYKGVGTRLDKRRRTAIWNADSTEHAYLFQIASTHAAGRAVANSFQPVKAVGRYVEGEDGSCWEEAAYPAPVEEGETPADPDGKMELTQLMIERDQDRLKNEVLLPWMRESVSYRAVFPALFVKPALTGKKVPGPIPYDALRSQYKDKNIALIGAAGTGKSTLLRQLYLFHNPKGEFLYLKAAALRASAGTLSAYEKGVLALLRGECMPREHRVILIDGIDEAFVSSGRELRQLIAKWEASLDRVSVWLGWRSDHYDQCREEVLDRFLDNVVALGTWEPDMVNAYVHTYAEKTERPELCGQFAALTKDNSAIREFAQIPFQLTLLLYLLENGALSSKSKPRFETASPTVYDLYHQFFLCWLKKERRRKTSYLTAEEIETELRRIAQALYYGQSCATVCTDTAVTDLLKFSPVPAAQEGERIARDFYHRSLCAYFCADEIFHAIREGGTALVKALSQPLRNDITDFVRSAIAAIQKLEELDNIRENLMRVYVQAVCPQNVILPLEVYHAVTGLSEDDGFYLRNELIYLITRLPSPPSKPAQPSQVEQFIAWAYEQETDPYMKLDLAYGAALTGPSRVALEYAGSLLPGEEADRVNRSWTLAYFGDVMANPYHYRDTGDGPWTKARAARLKRFQSGEEKAVRFRILDFPLMYCFYESRGWRDVNREDLEIIRRTPIDALCYTLEEKQFLAWQKERLVKEYERRLEGLQGGEGPER